MLGKITILSTFGSSYYEPVESKLGIVSSGEYLINTENIVRFALLGTTDTKMYYKLNRYEDNSPELILHVDETNANIVTLSDATPASNLVSLNVYEGAITFNDVSDLSTTAVMFNVGDIVWGNENNAGTCTRILVCEGGFTVKSFFVDHNINQIVDLADTGTTTTSTSTTSTTTTEA